MKMDHAHDLEARIHELEKADKAKDQFLALLSHELRNHIHAIRTNVWLIKARSRDVEIARPSDAIDRQVVKLSRLTEDLLDVIRSYLRWTLVPVAILTAFPEDPRLSRAAELGVTRVFTKSAFELNDLLACVNEHAGRSSEPPGRPEARG